MLIKFVVNMHSVVLFILVGESWEQDKEVQAIKVMYRHLNEICV